MDDRFMHDKVSKELINVARMIDLNHLAELSYEEIKKEIATFIKRAKSEGIDLDCNILYNEKTGLIKIDITKINNNKTIGGNTNG